MSNSNRACQGERNDQEQPRSEVMAGGRPGVCRQVEGGSAALWAEACEQRVQQEAARGEEQQGPVQLRQLE